MSCDKKMRFAIKQIDGEPTIPVSSDHRNGDWIATDIYNGELAQDTNTGAVYTRSGTKTLSTGAIPNEVMVAKFRVHQVGTNAPVVDEYYNPFNYTLTTVRDGAGLYRVLGFTNEEFTNTLNHYELRWSSNGLLGGSTLDLFPAADDEITLRTYDNTGTLGDNIIEETSAGIANWNVVTVTRYKV